MHRRFIGAFLLPLFLTTGSFSQQPASLERQRKSAFAFEQSGQLTEAEAAWKSILHVYPNDAEAYAHLGLLEAHQEHYRAAIADYRHAAQIDARMPGLQLNLGLALFKAGDLREAISTFEPILRQADKASPEALRLTTLIGLAHFGLGQYSAAIPYLKEATTADPQNLPFRLTLAQSCLWSKQYQCVLDVYHQILTLNAESAEADMLAGEAYDEMKDDTNAIEQFRAAARIDPKLPNVHFGYGYLLWRLLKYDEAEVEFKAELANNSEHALALTYLGDSEMRLNHPLAAAPYLEHALQLGSSIAIAHLDLGILYQDQGRKDDALRELKAAEALNTQDPTVHWHLARFYQSAGQKEEAQAEFAKTQGLQKAANQSVFEKLHQAQAKGQPAEETAPAAQPK